MIYASVKQFRQYADHLSTDIEIPGDKAEVEALLERASRDVCSYLRFPAHEVPEDVADFEREALAQAVIRQACYRVAKTESDLLEGAPDVLGAGGLSFAPGAPQIIGPETLTALVACPALWRSRHGLGVPADGDR